MDEIAFSDWPGSPVDHLSGSNPWLPAYGYQPPSSLLDKDDFLGNPDGALFLSNVVVGGGCDTQATAQYFCLETIVEETSDDLRSESSMSSSVCSGCSSDNGDEGHCSGDRCGRSPSDRHGHHHRWLATDSDSGSVIHVPDRCDCDACSDGGGNEAVDDRACFCSCNLNDLENEEALSRAAIDSSDSDGGTAACPRKRRRRCAGEDTTNVSTFGGPSSSLPPTSLPSAFSDNDSVHSSISRSSSLIQFESLEKHCQDQYSSSPSILSLFSQDSLERQAKQRCAEDASPDSLETSGSDSDDMYARAGSAAAAVATAANLMYGARPRLLSPLSYDDTTISINGTAATDDSSDDSQNSDDTLLVAGSRSHSPANGTSNSRTCRSYESLSTRRPSKQSSTRERMSAENLSEDSGYSDVPAGCGCGATSGPVAAQGGYGGIIIPHKSTRKCVNELACMNTRMTPPPPTAARKIANSRSRMTRSFDAYDGALNGLPFAPASACAAATCFASSCQDLIAAVAYDAGARASDHARVYRATVGRVARGTAPRRTTDVLNIVLECSAASKYNDDATASSYSEPDLLQLDAATAEHRRCLNTNRISCKQGYFGENLCVASVPKDLNLIGGGGDDVGGKDRAFVNARGDSVAAKNWDLCTLDANGIDNMAARNNISVTCGEIVKLSRHKREYPVNNNLDADVVIGTDQVDDAPTVQKAVSENSIRSFDDIFYHSTPVNKIIVTSTPNLTAIEIDDVQDKVLMHGSMQNVPLKSSLVTDKTDMKKATSASSSTKGVHFCPIVSEVSWAETSFSSSDSEAADEEDDLSSNPDNEDSSSSDEFIPLGGSSDGDDTARNTEKNKEIEYCVVPSTPANGDGSDADVNNGRNSNSTDAGVSVNVCARQSPPRHNNTSHVTRPAGAQHTHERASVIQSNQEDGQLTMDAEPPEEVHPSDVATADSRANNKSGTKFSSFLSRFASFRFTTRKSNKNKKERQKNSENALNHAPPPKSDVPTLNQRHQQRIATKDDYIYIPLKGPIPAAVQPVERCAGKPPLPPSGACASSRRRGAGDARTPHATSAIDYRASANRSKPDGRGHDIGHGTRGATVDAASRDNDASPKAPASGEASPSTRAGQARRQRMDGRRSPGLIETDLDTHVTKVVRGHVPGKTRSLMNLGTAVADSCMITTDVSGTRNHAGVSARQRLQDDGRTVATSAAGDASADARLGAHVLHHHQQRPHKSMEFLLDKDNIRSVQPPENELQKVTGGERVMSEHELRVQRSLQKLHLPDWYKQNAVPREGFILRKSSGGSYQSHQQQNNGGPRWSLASANGGGSKTPSLSSLGSGGGMHSPQLLSPAPPYQFTRWSTSRLNSAASSPCASTRSSFNHRSGSVTCGQNGSANAGGLFGGHGGLVSPRSSSFSYRQPYLGWRSQERLNKPRTPAERLAVSLLPANSLNTAEIQSSIKEVTSAIVHYVSALRPPENGAQGTVKSYGSGAGSSPRLDGRRSASPRGSQRLCWLESSFVGTRPPESPETPVTLAPQSDQKKTPVSPKRDEMDSDERNNGNVSSSRQSPVGLRLELEKRPNSRLCDDENDKDDDDDDGGGVVGLGRYDRPAAPFESPRFSRPGDLDHSCEDVVVVTADGRPSPGSTTLEDVLDSLLGLPPQARPTSPAQPEIHGSTVQETTSANTSPNKAEASNRHAQHQHYRRRSEGSEPASAVMAAAAAAVACRAHASNRTPSEPPQRRVSFHNYTQNRTPPSGPRYAGIVSPPSGSGTPTTDTLKCRNTKCGKISLKASDSGKAFKNCHNCTYIYCSRECRRAHWEKHRKLCLFSRVGALCRQVLAAAKEHKETLQKLSVLARQGYMSHGSGAVKLFFPGPEVADKFIDASSKGGKSSGSHGPSNASSVAAIAAADAATAESLPEPVYVGWADLQPSEMGPNLYKDLVKMCKTYNPDTRFVLYVSVCVVSEVPASGAVKWERQLVSRCAKIRLSKSVIEAAQSQPMPLPPNPPIGSVSGVDKRRLASTSNNHCREASFANIQKQLKHRGISLRKQFPDVYAKLCAYVEGRTDKFSPVTIYPRDATTGTSFVVVIMPDVMEPDKLKLKLPSDNQRTEQNSNDGQNDNAHSFSSSRA